MPRRSSSIDLGILVPARGKPSAAAILLSLLPLVLPHTCHASFTSAFPSICCSSSSVTSPSRRATPDRPILIQRRSILATTGSIVATMSISSKLAAAAAAPATDSPNQKEINWGIVGLGDVTAIKSGPAFYKCSGSNLVAVIRRTPGAAARWVEENAPPNSPSIRAYDDLDRFLKDERLDAVYVATPPGAHKDVALRVAKAKLPCYVEKPVGRCGAETAAIVRAFEKEGLPLFTAYVSRAYERTAAVRRLLADGAVGERVDSITYRLVGSGGARGMDTDELPWRLHPKTSGGGLIMDVGCHVLDRLDYLFGPLVDVTGKAENRASPNQPVEDYVEVCAKIGECDWGAIESEGATVKCTWDFGNRNNVEPVDELIIKGERGTLVLAAMSPSLPVTAVDSKGDEVHTLTFEAPQHAAQPLIQLVTDELRGVDGVRALSRGANALRTSEVLDTVLSGYYGGREDGFWDRASDTWPGCVRKSASK